MGSEGNLARFEHPLIQVASMFLGELCCMLAYFIYKAVKKEELEEAGEGFIKFENPRHGYLFIIPACCDCCATGMMYFGLLWVSASLFRAVAEEEAGMVPLAGDVCHSRWSYH